MQFLKTLMAKLFFQSPGGKRCRVPLFGVRAVGKSYFSYTLAHFLAREELGHVDGDGMRAMDTIIQRMLQRKPLDATMGNHDYNLHIHGVRYDDYMKVIQESAGQAAGLENFIEAVDHEDEDPERKVAANLILSTNDMSGSEFSLAMEQLSEPNATLGGEPMTAKFIEILHGCDGCVAVIDMVRNETITDNNREQVFRLALAEQVVPIIRGIELAILQRNTENRLFPLFLVFPKADLHRLSRRDLYEMMEDVLALLLARLRDKVQLRIHTIVNLGFAQSDRDDSYFGDQEGVGFFLADLVAFTRKF